MRFAPLLLNLVSVGALSIPSPVREISDNASPSLVLSNNPSTLTLPSPIPGFKAKVTLGKTSTLVARDVLVNAFQLMVYLSKSGWEHYLNHPVILAAAQGTEEIVLSPLVQPPSPSEFKIKHAVWGLYDASVAISRRMSDRPRFVPQAYTGLFLHGRLTGFYKMQHKTSSLDSVAANNTLRLFSSYGNVNTTSDFTQGNDLHGTSLAHTETQIDDGDSKFKIRYTPDTTEIGAADLFTAFMDALATAAQFDNTAMGAYVNAAAASGECAVNVHGIGLSSRFSWALLIQTLNVVYTQIIWPQKGWKGLDFDVIYNDLKVGEGFVFALPLLSRLGSNGTRVAASEK